MSPHVAAMVISWLLAWQLETKLGGFEAAPEPGRVLADVVIPFFEILSGT